MKREYKIGHFKIDNERVIFRECEDMVQWLTREMVWSSNKKLARRFLHKQDCESALSIVKFSKWLKTEEEYIEDKINESKEVRSRGELPQE